MNSFFRLVVTQNNTMLELVPPTDGGVSIDINELAVYLQLKQIRDVDIAAIYRQIQTLGQEPVMVPVCNSPIYPVHESCIIRVSEDKMRATARFYPASNTGKPMEKAEILSDLAHHKISFGIDEAAIDAFLANRQYCTDIVLATGMEPRHGTDAWIEYFFNTDLSAKPTRNEDGSVDFFSLNTINHCKEGDLLARLHPEDRGEYGCNVLGERIRPRDVKHLYLKFGRNIAQSEDKLEIRSEINGHVMLTEGKVFVSDVYEVENVGTATGNITSQGSVVVNGNVQAGFSIQAEGNVEVKGVVEGASITAGGDIIIARGMNGMGKGILKAGGKIITKFVENATVEAGASVEADSIMHSRVSAKTEVTVDGRKGFIAGGAVRASQKISCKTLGSEMGADTVVEVGIDPQQKARYVELQKEMQELQKKNVTIKTTVAGAAVKIKEGNKLSPDQMKYIQSLMQAGQQIDERLAADDEELGQLELMMGAKDDACVCVKDVAYAGTRIVIGEDSTTLHSNVKFCRFKNVGAEIKAMAY